MSERIKKIFETKEKKLVTFTTGGDPDFNTSLEILKTIINNGIDIIEIGMPFLTPWLTVLQFKNLVLDLYQVEQKLMIFLK